MEPRQGEPLDHLGERAGDRPPPRFSTIIGAVGGLTIAFGAYVLAGEVSDDAARAVGIVVSLLLVAAGVYATSQRSDGSVHLAGVAAAALAVPPLMFFVVFDSDFDASKSSMTAVLILAGAAYAGLYLLGPTRGQAVFLGGALAAVWLVLMVQLVEPNQVNPFAALELESESTFQEPDFSSDFDDGGFDPEADFDFESDADSDLDSDFDFDSGDSDGGGAFLAPDAAPAGGGNDAGLVSLVVGAVYLIAAFALGSRDRDRMATPFLAVGDVALTIGLLAVAGDAGAAAGSFLAIVVGAALVWFASATERRFTAWLGGLFVLGGLVAFVAEITNENGVAGGLLLLAVGAGVVAGAELITGTKEPKEMGAPPPSPPAPAP